MLTSPDPSVYPSCTHKQFPTPEVVVDEINTTKTAVYAAVDPNISALLAFVRIPTLVAKSTVNIAISPNCVFLCFIIFSTTTAPTSSIAAMTMLIAAATAETWISLMCSVPDVIFFVCFGVSGEGGVRLGDRMP
jgi:hypothetical protein